MLTHSDTHLRLKEAREEAGYDSAAAAARAIGIPEGTYSTHENGARNLTNRVARRYADFYRVRLEWLLDGKGPKRKRSMIPLTGRLGENSTILPLNDPSTDFIDADLEIDIEDVATLITGDHLFPLRDGWALVWKKRKSGVPPQALNQLCVVHTAAGENLLKFVRRGLEPDHFTLEGWNEPVRENVPVEWASPVKAILMDPHRM